MLLAIDVGNTHTVIGLFRGAELAAHWRIATVADRTADEHRLWLQNIIGMEGFGKEHLAGVAAGLLGPGRAYEDVCLPSLAAAMDLLRDFGIREIARSGKIAISREKKNASRSKKKR